MCQNRNERDRQTMTSIFPYRMCPARGLAKWIAQIFVKSKTLMQFLCTEARRSFWNLPLLSKDILLLAILLLMQGWYTCCAYSWDASIQFFAWLPIFAAQLVMSLEGTCLAMPVWNSTVPMNLHCLSLLIIYFLPEVCHTSWSVYRISGFCQSPSTFKLNHIRDPGYSTPSTYLSARPK